MFEVTLFTAAIDMTGDQDCSQIRGQGAEIMGVAV